MSAAGLFRLTRPANSAVAGLAAILAYFIATGTLVPQVILLCAIVILITAAGNVINDYFDAEIDAINRPDRPIPSGNVTRGMARAFATILFLAGLLISLYTSPLCVAIALVNCLLLVLYAAWLKSTPFFGNASVAYLAASIFLFGGGLAGISGLVHVLPLAFVTFLATISRELLKAAEDVDGDRAGGADTLPVRIGIPLTVLIAFIAALGAALASIVPYVWWGPGYLLAILAVDIFILVSAGRALNCTTPACVKVSKATTRIKIGMFAALLVFLLSALFFASNRFIP